MEPCRNLIKALISEGCRFRSFMTVQEEKTRRRESSRITETKKQQRTRGKSKTQKQTSKKRTHPGTGHRAPPGSTEEVQNTRSDSECMVGTP